MATMHALTAADLLSAWERAFGRKPFEQALVLLSVDSPETPPQELAALPIGQRDARLLTLRERMFGPRLAMLATCPACRERLDVNVDVAEIRARPGAGSEAPLMLSEGGYEVEFRLVNSLDLAAAGAAASSEAAQRVLFGRCLVDARRAGERFSADCLPTAIVDAVASRMEDADPQAEVRLSLSCAACRHAWQSVFDIVWFLWSEIDAWARRLLIDVHALASAYGWSEAAILNMSPWRRQLYLDMLRR